MSNTETLPYSVSIEGSVVHLLFEDDLILDERIIRQIQEELSETGIDDVRLLVEHGLNNEITFKAQKCMAQAVGISKVALYLNHPRYAPVFNHLINITAVFNRKYDMKIFSDPEEARRWLAS